MEFTLVQATILAVAYAIALAVTPFVHRIIGEATQGSERDRHLDGMRAVAAVAVVACHVNQYMVSFLGYTNPLFGDHAGILGVQMFFALTAFLFVDRALNGKLDAERFYIGRIRRILPLYVAVCGAAFAIAFWQTWDQVVPMRQMAVDAVKVVSYGFWKTDEIAFRGINMLSLIGIAWTLSYEWAFYLLLVPACCLWRTGRTTRIAIGAIVLAIAIRDFHLHAEQVIWPFFLPGIAAAFLKDRISPTFGRIFLLLAVPAAVLVFWLPGFWTPVKLGLASILFFGVLFGKPRWLTWRPLQTLGIVSYSIYLVQYLVLYPAVQLIYVSPSLASIEARLATGALVVVATVGLAALTYRFIELPWMTSPRSSTAGRDPVGHRMPQVEPGNA